MDPAFPGCVGLPPPAAGALRLAGLHRPGAGLAPAREKALRVKRIDRHTRGLGEPHHFLARPIEERRDLDQPALLIPSAAFYPTALVGLVRTRPRTPGGGHLQCAPKRHDLP